MSSESARRHHDRNEVDVSIIIVSWNVWNLLRACLRSVESCSRPVDLDMGEAVNDRRRIFGCGGDAATLEVIVVDNGSNDATSSLIPSLFPWVHLIKSETNLGFTVANNLGYRHARGDTLYFLNPDTELVGNSLWILYLALRSDPTIGAIGPRLQYAQGNRQNNRRRFPTRWTGFWESTWLGQLWPENPWVTKLHMNDWPDDIRHDVDWLVGAALLVRRQAIESVSAKEMDGPFDERFFMYSEELDLCQRIKHAGWRNVFLPEALVIHYEGQSSEQALAHRHVYFNTSKVRYYQKYFGGFWANLLRRYLLLEFGCQILIEGLKYFLHHKPELRQNRISIYRQVLKSSLIEGTLNE